ncbi:hypothetical protein MMC30_004181 [Trapelia coarctata]|nr:hypothetical protein [Trapelia coarctata]
MAQWNDSLLLDILGELCFGRSFGLKEPGENPLKAIPHAVTSYASFMYPITQSPMLEVWLWLKPRGLNYLLEWMAPREVRDYYSFVKASVAERTDLETRLQNEQKNQRRDIFHYLFQAKDPYTGEPAYSPDELDAEANMLIIGGFDTAAVALCGFFSYLTRNPRVQAKLVAELHQIFTCISDIRSGPALSSCVYLRACIDEALRMCPPGVSEFVREVLPGGTEVAGEFFPAGVRLGTANWAINHHESFFPDPYVYRPERWIVDPDAGVMAEEVARARSCVHPFSAGPANCVGKSLALMELMITVGRVLYGMEVRAEPGSRLGEGAPELGWGRRNRNQYQVGDAYISLRDGPMLQFKRCSGKG